LKMCIIDVLMHITTFWEASRKRVQLFGVCFSRQMSFL
jgi:hypothetical protein